MLKLDSMGRFRLTPGKKTRLKQFDTVWDEAKDFEKRDPEQAQQLMSEKLAELSRRQEVLYADDRYSLLIVLQAMDAAGKDSTIKRVMSGVNPQGCQVFAFKKPSSEELDHDFLWRYMRNLPERGRIGIFNRSYYEDVLIVKVHPEILAEQKLPHGKPDKDFWKGRYSDINAMERHLVRSGTIVLKFFLHVSKHEQKKRLLARLEKPEKLWKFSVQDLQERQFWGDYMDAYEEALAATSTGWAPWHVIPADHKWTAQYLIAHIVTKSLRKLDLDYPKVSDAQTQALAEAKRLLESE